MRKLSILVLVVILVGALSLAGYSNHGKRKNHGKREEVANQAINQNTVSDTAESTVTFGTASVISINISSGRAVFFGTNLNPGDTYYKINKTSLNVKSNRSWEIDVSKSGGAKDKLSVRFGVNTENTFSQGSSTYSGSSDENGIGVSYKLDNLDELSTGNKTVTVTFTATAD